MVDVARSGWSLDWLLSQFGAGKLLQCNGIFFLFVILVKYMSII